MSQRLPRRLVPTFFALLIGAQSPGTVGAQASQTPDEAAQQQAEKAYEEAKKNYEAAAQDVRRREEDVRAYGPVYSDEEVPDSVWNDLETARIKLREAREKLDAAENDLGVFSGDKKTLEKILKWHREKESYYRRLANSFRRGANREETQGLTSAAEADRKRAEEYGAQADEHHRKQIEIVRKLQELKTGGSAARAPGSSPAPGTSPIPRTQPGTPTDAPAVPGEGPDAVPVAGASPKPDDALPLPEEPEPQATPDKKTLEKQIKDADKRAKALDQRARDDERRANSWNEAANRAERIGDTVKAAEHRKLAEGFAADAKDERRQADEARRESAALRTQLADLRAGRPVVPIATGNPGPTPDSPVAGGPPPPPPPPPGLVPGETPGVRPAVHLDCTLRKNRGYQGETFTTSILERLEGGASLTIAPADGVTVLQQTNSTGARLDVKIAIDTNAPPGPRSTVCTSPDGSTATTANGFTVDQAPASSTPVGPGTSTGPATPDPPPPPPPPPAESAPVSDCGFREGATAVFVSNILFHDAGNHDCNAFGCLAYRNGRVNVRITNVRANAFQAQVSGPFTGTLECSVAVSCAASCNGRLPGSGEEVQLTNLSLGTPPGQPATFQVAFPRGGFTAGMKRQGP
jgi:hypothetical protein